MPPPKHRAAGWGGGQSGCCRGIPQTATKCLFFHFFFLRNSSCSSLPLHTRKGLSFHTAHLSSYTGDYLVQGPSPPNSQLSPASAQSPWVLTDPMCLPLHPYSPPCNFKQLGLSQCCSNLVWQGRELLTQLSHENPEADLVGTGPGAAVTLVPSLVPGTLLSSSTLLTVGFSMSSTIFGL